MCKIISDESVGEEEEEVRRGLEELEEFDGSWVKSRQTQGLGSDVDCRYRKSATRG